MLFRVERTQTSIFTHILSAEYGEFAKIAVLQIADREKKAKPTFRHILLILLNTE